VDSVDKDALDDHQSDARLESLYGEYVSRKSLNEPLRLASSLVRDLSVGMDNEAGDSSKEADDSEVDA
jgi:hypothetical protein